VDLQTLAAALRQLQMQMSEGVGNTRQAAQSKTGTGTVF